MTSNSLFLSIPSHVVDDLATHVPFTHLGVDPVHVGEQVGSTLPADTVIVWVTGVDTTLSELEQMNDAVYSPATLYVCDKVVTNDKSDFSPSPKFKSCVTAPGADIVNFTLIGAVPVTGVADNVPTGALTVHARPFAVNTVFEHRYCLFAAVSQYMDPFAVVPPSGV